MTPEARSHTKVFIVALCVILTSLSLAAHGDVNGYLPLNDRSANHDVDRLIQITQAPIARKPYSLALIRDLAPQIRESHPTLYRDIVFLLRRFQKRSGVVGSDINLSFTSGAPQVARANARGESLDSTATIHLNSYYRISDSMIAFGGLKATDSTSGTTKEVQPLNTYIAIGGRDLQLDIGYRDTWLSPFKSSSTLLSNNAATAPSITLSNALPYERFANFSFETSLQQLSYQEDIKMGIETTNGNPVLLTTQFSLEPLKGWTVSAIRTMQFGGGDREVSIKTIWDAFIDPVRSDNQESSGFKNCDAAALNACELGNQLAALTTKIYFPGEYPISLYAEYAGEDTSEHSNIRLGNLMISGGASVSEIDFLGSTLDLTAEFTQWQNLVYVHDIYPEGYHNYQLSIGHWMDNYRPFISHSPGTSLNLLANLKTQEDLFSVSVDYISLDPIKASERFSSGYNLELSWQTDRFASFPVSLSASWGQTSTNEDYIIATVSAHW